MIRTPSFLLLLLSLFSGIQSCIGCQYLNQTHQPELITCPDGHSTHFSYETAADTTAPLITLHHPADATIVP